MSEPSQIDRACAWLDEVKALIREKNAAYGDSAFQPIGVFSKLPPSEGIRLRIDDKIKRIMMGNEGGNEDTIKDLAGYLALLAVVEE